MSLTSYSSLAIFESKERHGGKSRRKREYVAAAIGSKSDCLKVECLLNALGHVVLPLGTFIFYNLTNVSR